MTKEEIKKFRDKHLVEGIKKLRRAKKFLMLQDPYFASIMQDVEFSFTFEFSKVPFAGVCAIPSGHKMYLNVYYLNLASVDNIQATLYHELLHIVYGHCTIVADLYPDKERANKAMDYEINQHVTLGYNQETKGRD